MDKKKRSPPAVLLHSIDDLRTFMSVYAKADGDYNNWYTSLISNMFEHIPSTYLLSVHIAAFAWSVVGIIAADTQGVRWLLGWVPMLRVSYVRFWHRWVWCGLLVSIVSGFLMFWPVREYLLTQPTFLLKITLVLVLCLNALFIGTHMVVATQQPFSSLSSSQRRALLVSGVVSLLGWISVAALGFLSPL